MHSPWDGQTRRARISCVRLSNWHRPSSVHHVTPTHFQFTKLFPAAMSTVQTIELHQLSLAHRNPGVLQPIPEHSVPRAGATCHQTSSNEPRASVTPAPGPVQVFSAIEPVITSPVSQTVRFAIISLLITANLIQVCSPQDDGCPGYRQHEDI